MDFDLFFGRWISISGKLLVVRQFLTACLSITPLTTNDCFSCLFSFHLFCESSCSFVLQLMTMLSREPLWTFCRTRSESCGTLRVATSVFSQPPLRGCFAIWEGPQTKSPSSALLRFGSVPPPLTPFFWE